jgi:phosphoribosyl-ATP pyrophosphohydrolase
MALKQVMTFAGFVPADELNKGIIMELTKKQIEQLHCLQEEAAEVIQAVSKILRHGYESTSPFDQTKTTNRVNLERELGDLSYWINVLADNSEINLTNVSQAQMEKANSCRPYLHYQD